MNIHEPSMTKSMLKIYLSTKEVTWHIKRIAYETIKIKHFSFEGQTHFDDFKIQKPNEFGTARHYQNGHKSMVRTFRKSNGIMIILQR